MDGFLIKRGKRILTKALFLAMTFELIGCSSSRTEQPTRQTVLSADVAPGVVLIDVLESGKPEHYCNMKCGP
jgi:hypothetical protein